MESFVTGWCLAAGIADKPKDYLHSFEQENEEIAQHQYLRKEEK